MMTQATPSVAKQVVILVDDDEGVRNSIRNMMEGEGFVVHAFSNGHDLLNDASLPATGCLVVDYHMPAMNGLELVSALRGRGVSIPAILILLQVIPPNMCATEPRQLQFWSSRSLHQETICCIVSARQLRSMGKFCREVFNCLL